MIWSNIIKAGRILLDFCYPPKCILCQAPLEGERGSLCPKCVQAIPWTGENCIQLGIHFDRCVSPLYYTDVVKPSFHRYKFQGHWHYNWVYGQWMWEYLRRYDPNYRRFDCITWAPLSFWRYQRRGYDQARRLATAVSKASKIPLVRTLVKRKHTPPQSGTEKAEQRWENVRGAYRPRGNRNLMGKRILLVDDIITTGATLEEASSVLQKMGALEVCCLTLARSAVFCEENRNSSC